MNAVYTVYSWIGFILVNSYGVFKSKWTYMNVTSLLFNFISAGYDPLSNWLRSNLVKFLFIIFNHSFLYLIALLIFRPQKGKVYMQSLTPCLINIARRKEESILETLALSVPKIFSALGPFGSDNQIKVCYLINWIKRFKWIISYV